MLLPFKNAKTYGVIHTENYFTFLGFCKNVNNDEIQKIDVFLNDELIDTIDANKNLQKINDLYDIDGFSFIYNLSEIYIGEKNKISFRNHKTKEELQNSPYFLIDKTHPKFNELRFFYTLTLPINKDKIKNSYLANTLGFLATEEDLKNQEFIDYIENLQKRFQNIKINIFYLNNKQKELTEELFKNLKNIKLINPKNIYEINENCLIWLTTNNELSLEIRKHIRFSIFINFNDKKLTIKDYENKYKNSFRIFYSNPNKFGETNNSSFFGIAYNNLIKSLDANLSLNTNTNYFEFSSFVQVELALKYKPFINKLKELSSLLKE